MITEYMNNVNTPAPASQNGYASNASDYSTSTGSSMLDRLDSRFCGYGPLFRANGEPIHYKTLHQLLPDLLTQATIRTWQWIIDYYQTGKELAWVGVTRIAQECHVTPRKIEMDFAYMEARGFLNKIAARHEDGYFVNLLNFQGLYKHVANYISFRQEHGIIPPALFRPGAPLYNSPLAKEASKYLIFERAMTWKQRGRKRESPPPYEHPTMSETEISLEEWHALNNERAARGNQEAQYIETFFNAHAKSFSNTISHKEDGILNKILSDSDSSPDFFASHFSEDTTPRSVATMPPPTSTTTNDIEDCAYSQRPAIGMNSMNEPGANLQNEQDEHMKQDELASIARQDQLDQEARQVEMARYAWLTEQAELARQSQLTRRAEMARGPIRTRRAQPAGSTSQPPAPAIDQQPPENDAPAHVQRLDRETLDTYLDQTIPERHSVEEEPEGEDLDAQPDEQCEYLLQEAITTFRDQAPRSSRAQLANILAALKPIGIGVDEFYDLINHCVRVTMKTEARSFDRHGHPRKMALFFHLLRKKRDELLEFARQRARAEEQYQQFIQNARTGEQYERLMHSAEQQRAAGEQYDDTQQEESPMQPMQDIIQSNQATLNDRLRHLEQRNEAEEVPPNLLQTNTVRGTMTPSKAIFKLMLYTRDHCMEAGDPCSQCGCTIYRREKVPGLPETGNALCIMCHEPNRWDGAARQYARKLLSEIDQLQP